MIPNRRGEGKKEARKSLANKDHKRKRGTAELLKGREENPELSVRVVDTWKEDMVERKGEL